MKTIVIVQSNYIPWRGYFAMIALADELILLDSVQYTRNDWRNRNIIKTPLGPQWLTIPIERCFPQPIDQARIAAADWAERHIRAIEHNYRRAKAFDEAASWLFPGLRTAAGFPLLTQVNVYLIGEICRRLGIDRPIRRCTDIAPRDVLASMEPTERLIHLCGSVGATCYLTGRAAEDYLLQDKFGQAGIELKWMDYGGMPEYPQCWEGFEPRVSIIDLLLNCGASSPLFLQNRPQGLS
jgi:hypothetical protein